MTVFKAKTIVEGFTKAPALVVERRISFYGDVDPVKGVLKKENTSLRNMVLIIPGVKGSTVGSYIIYSLRKNHVAPAAIVSLEADPILVAGCVLAEIPLVTVADQSILKKVKNGEIVVVDAYRGVVAVED